MSFVLEGEPLAGQERPDQAVFASSNNMLRDDGVGHEPGSRIYGSTEATAAAGASSCYWDYQLSVHSVNIDQTGAAGWQPPVEGC